MTRPSRTTQLILGAAVALGVISGCSEGTEPAPTCWAGVGPDGAEIRALENTAHGLFAGGEGTVWRYDGRRWASVLPGIQWVSDILYLPDPDYLLVSTTPGVVDLDSLPQPPWTFASADGGESWTGIDSEGDATLGGGPTFLLAANGDPPALLAGDGPKVIRSTDLGESWELVRGAPESWGGITEAARFSPANGWVWLGGTDAWGDPIIYRSTDAGTTWDYTRAAPDSVHGRSIGDFAIDPADPAHVLAGSMGGILETRDGGASWTWMWPSTAGHPDTYNTYRAFLRVEGALYAIGVTGIGGPPPYAPIFLRSPDFGTSWTPIELPDGGFSDIQSFVYIDETATFALGTDNGVWFFDPDAEATCLPQP